MNKKEKEKKNVDVEINGNHDHTFTMAYAGYIMKYSARSNTLLIDYSVQDVHAAAQQIKKKMRLIVDKSVSDDLLLYLIEDALWESHRERTTPEGFLNIVICFNDLRTYIGRNGSKAENKYWADLPTMGD